MIYINVYAKYNVNETISCECLMQKLIYYRIFYRSRVFIEVVFYLYIIIYEK